VTEQSKNADQAFTPEDHARFWEKVEITDLDDCWLWTASTDKDGYGQFKLNGRKLRAHQVAVLLDGRDPTGKVVRHLCHNPRCVNPNHLAVGTHRANSRDMVRLDRQPRGERNGQSQLSDEDVRKIRKSGETSRELAKQFGTSESNIRMIRTGRSWKHVH